MRGSLPDRTKVDRLVSHLGSRLTGEVADRIASVYSDQLVLPDRVMVDEPGGSSRLFPGWPSSVLVISIENQGVCSWGVPLDDDSAPPVLVGGDLLDRPQPTTVRYCRDVEAFIATRDWDRQCLSAPLLQAQASAVDNAAAEYLTSRFREVLPTYGWPGHWQRRFERGTARVMLWLQNDQCDWWISDADRASLVALGMELLPLADLRQSLWSNDAVGELALEEIRRTSS